MRHTVWNEIYTREHLSWNQLETGMWPGVRHTDIIVRKSLPDSEVFLFFSCLYGCLLQNGGFKSFRDLSAPCRETSAFNGSELV